MFIKAVLQAIPTYIIRCFLLPKSFCDKIEIIYRGKVLVAEGLWEKGLALV